MPHQRLQEGQAVRCRVCGQPHTLRAARNLETRERGYLLFYECQGQRYLGAVNGESVLSEPKLDSLSASPPKPERDVLMRERKE